MKKLLLALLLTITFILTGCGTVQVDIESDGSAEITYKIPLEETYLSLDDLKGQIKASVKESNEEVGYQNIKVKSAKEKKNVATIVLEVKDLSDTNSTEVILAPVKDVSRMYLDELVNTEDKDGKKASTEKLKKNEDAIALIMDNDDMLEEVTITTPGKILYASEGAKIDGKKVTSSDSELVVIYEEGGSGIFKTIIIILVALVVVFVAFRFLKAKKLGKPGKIQATKLVEDNNNA